MAVNGLNSVIPSVTPGTSSLGTAMGKTSQPDFREALKTIQSTDSEVKGSLSENLKFSNHAIERMRTRGISFDPETMQRIELATQKAAAKGSKNTLLLTNDSALIVSVKDKTVVTVLDRQAMKDNVFTNIDSTVMV